MTSILARLKQLKPEVIEPTAHRGYMHPTVLECNLIRLDCSPDIIQDALAEPPERWEEIIKYYEKVKSQW